MDCIQDIGMNYNHGQGFYGDLNCQFWTYHFTFTVDVNFSWDNGISIKGCGEKYYVVRWR